MYGYGSTYDVYIGNRAGTRALSVAANSTVVSIPDTTASTTTSTGALVVGNGTSGGLGVGGAGYFGGLLNISSTAGLYAQWKKTDAASGSQSWAWIVDNNGTLFLQAANDNFVGANNYLSFTRSGVTPGTTTIHGTTASTSTSSGALVVSGGVGVAGAIYAGGDIITTKSNGVIKASGSSANAEVSAQRLTTTPSSVSMVAAVSQPQLAFTSDTAGSYTWGRILANSSEIVRVHSANLTAIANVAGAGIAVAGGIINTGSLTTGAPSGGTAAAWKLGTVATVSPTSPNRTIEVDIGGTIYYIHAKTTNN
jgi:hypothetical protein